MTRENFHVSQNQQRRKNEVQIKNASKLYNTLNNFLVAFFFEIQHEIDDLTCYRLGVLFLLLFFYYFFSLFYFKFPFPLFCKGQF